MKICLTGGGTAGHIIPNMALIPEFRKYFDEIIYIGGINSMEKRIISTQNDIKFYEIHSAKLIRHSLFKNLKLPFLLARGYFDAKKILKRERPNILFSKGGYVSIPAVFAAKRLKIPIYCHESDFSLGLANKITSKYAKATFTSFKETAEKIKNGVYSGSPIRSEIMTNSKSNAIKKLNITSTKPVLLITGGSLGAKRINDEISNILPYLTSKFFVLHITGKNYNQTYFSSSYRVIEYASNMEDYIAAADYIISRAGSNTIFELLYKNKPMLLIPLQKGSRGDQVENAESFKSHGYANILYENEMEKLKESIDELVKKATKIRDNQRLSNTKQANSFIVSYIIKNEIKK